MRPWTILCGILAAAILLVGCSDSKLPERSSVPSPPSESDGPPTAEQLLSMEYTITDPAVRSVLTKARKTFFVAVRDGRFDYSASARVYPFHAVRVDAASAAIGDVTGDTNPDAVVVITIGEGESSVTELAAVSVLSGSVKHIASFPLGHAEVRSVKIANGKIRVNFTHLVPGDPGPRNTELTLSL